MSRFSRLSRLLAILCVLLVASSCGVPEDTESRPLNANAIPESLRPGQLPETDDVPIAEGATQRIFLVGPDNRLITVFRAVDATPEAVIESLLLAETQAERNIGIETAITRNTEVVAIDVPAFFDQATVTLTPDSLSSSSQDRILGFAQIVFTLTELEGIEKISFQTTTGDALRVQTDVGLKEPGEVVQRADFASIDPGRNLIPSFPDEDVVPTVEPTLVPDPVGRTIEVPIWIVNEDNQLVPVTRRVERSPAALMQTLLDGVLEVERQQGFRSAITEDALARSVEPFTVVDVERGALNTAVVDLVPGSLPPFERGDERTLAVAQMVYTLTGLIEVDQVLFSIDGVPTAMPTQLGLSADYDPENPAYGLSRSDYSIYTLTIQVTQQPVPTPGGEATPIPLPTSTPVPTPAPTPTQTP